MYTTDFQIRVRYAETDQMNVVYHAHYVTYFEVARTEAIRALGFTYREMEIMGVEMPVTELSIRYLRPAHYDDLLTVKTQLRTLPEKHDIDFFQEIYNEQGKLITSGKVTLFFLNKESKKRSKMPDILKEKLALHFE